MMGVGVGLTAGPSTAAMVEFSAEGQAKRAASITASAQAFGFAAALLLGGALTQYAPWPTHLSFWVLFTLIALLFTATWFLPRHVGGQAASRWRPKVPSLPPGLRTAFTLASIAVTTAYTHGVLILSLGGQVARDLVGSPNALINGTALSLFAVTSGVLGIVARGLGPRPAMMLGAMAPAVGMGLLALSVAWHELGIFLAATAMSGVGYSLLFLGGMALINGTVATERRGGVLSAVYLLAYFAWRRSAAPGGCRRAAGARPRRRPRRRRHRPAQPRHNRCAHHAAAQPLPGHAMLAGIIHCGGALVLRHDQGLNQIFLLPPVPWQSLAA